ncbi:phosphate acyltransferase PlsX [Apilactobacillus timberlakei]|uniref:phosphate acyltransferase PlsX n=1 Tax=Apilactobacillus timberlakei TaxID=2008380 RepID=UPI00112AC886|nr:phosphate acyltransferase PlsX [Apilactobacillus timberlakei]TPR16822.1 phosphate acyltransferase PlsX [Apilactobacillus timberlakei]TPR20194.1 phosphate acyltransferase PlsX [Apilactobacillus timberlakei]TPR21912.1 phosphate acyltransferase PlsX [Apilactobacillus timberlakei]TPR22313.1 phosphate acyltransferase PlsX [Apilactobacillus timberlakei]TPR24086.1 phosphate acyltransferase PlsX [Apilactobacillus timberlakei]
MKIAIDAMGGDYAPTEVVKGVELARNAYPDIEFKLFGQIDKIKPLIENEERIELIQSDEIIEMAEEPVKAVMKKKNSSLDMAAQSVKDHEADAFFSAGNTGAILAAGLFIIGRIKGIDRPGLATTLPIVNDPEHDNFVMLDVGANAESKLFNLYQYAFMGKYYAENVRKINNPRIGLLNNGTESDKGDSLHKAANELLSKDNNLNFIGNVESRELLNGAADVVITDGFTGNAALKAIEGTALSLLTLIKGDIMSAGLKSKFGALMLKPTFKKIGKQMDYSQYGGAVLMGTKAPVVKAHGSSKANTIKNTIFQIKSMIDSKTIDNVVSYFDKNSDKMAEIKQNAKNK